MSLSEFRHPALSRKELDEAVPSVVEAVPEYGQEPDTNCFPTVRTKVDTLMCTNKNPRHSATVKAGSVVEIIATVSNSEYRSHVVRFQEQSGEFIYCLIGRHLVEAV